jgi:hypothetical protein
MYVGNIFFRPAYEPFWHIFKVNIERRDMKNSKKRLSVKAQLANKVAKQKINQKNDAPPDLVPGNEADVNTDDLEALGPKNLSQDMGDDEDLKHRIFPVDFSGDDLDVPGVELDDEAEKIGSEDEENNSYSIGGDAHNKLDETNNI